MGKLPENIVRIQPFVAAPDVEIIIGTSETILLMPVLKRLCDKWVDATGDFDLCMSDDGLKYTFINRLGTTETFAYRFLSANWSPTRLQQGR